MARDEPSYKSIPLDSPLPTPWDGFVAGPENSLAAAGSPAPGPGPEGGGPPPVPHRGGGGRRGPVTRWVGGLAVRADPPGLPPRGGLVLDRAGARGLALSAEAVEALAAAGDGYRTLEGWLARLGLAGRLGKQGPGRPL